MTTAVPEGINPDVKVVYVDLDPVVCIHGRALLASDQVAIVQGDVRKPYEILADPAVQRLIDPGAPVGILMMFLLHLIADSDTPQDMVAGYRKAAAPGSVLAISHAANDARPEYVGRISAIYQRANTPFTPRSRADINAFFGDWPLDGPGLVNMWPYAEVPADVDADLAQLGYSSVAVKPA
ncbi:hypothetical protein BJ973_000056 [Actinoplanes tereljensis]|uniref:S-adenosyl methyltransferase n=1 Tax=Paractinoplanes tereljensis TaxID=571912 RepID=A0A919P072_9ACTN|nr:SAM-dependent methyltransferase [Actinoplanes tereljensis]GIF26852.1 hypothetical protein Ate02nite_95820 [Actinoplanes tereljensis]